MIVLNVDPYCHGCDEFVPVVKRIYTEDFLCDRHVQHDVHCEHAGRCNRIVRYLQKELKRSGGEQMNA